MGPDRRRAAGWLLACAVAVIAAAPARAQTDAPEAPVLFLEVTGDGARDGQSLDAEGLRAALATALSSEVRLGAAGGAELPRLEVRVVGEQLLFRFREADGELTRLTDAPRDPRERLTVATLIGASLVRDDAESLLSMLDVPEPEAFAREPEPEPIAEPIAEPEPVAEPVVEAVREAPDSRPNVGFAMDLLPGIGASSIHGGSERRRGSIGILGDLYGALDGYAVGTFLTMGGDVRGVQQTLGVTAALQVDGAQLGVVNVAADAVSGAQIGLVNVTGGPVRGAQIGLINIAESADAGIGLLNFYTRGRTHLEVTGDSAGSLRLAVKHGIGPMHTIYSVGVNPFYGETVMLVGMGVGARADLADVLFLAFDVVAHYAFDSSWQFPLSFLTSARALAGLRPIPELAVVFGLGLDVHNTSDPDAPLYTPVLGASFDGGVRLWPSLVLGVQLFR